MGTKHTPGPWKISGHFIGDDIGETVAYVSDHRNERQRSNTETNANARLIAAAPELLEAIENMSAAFETLLAHYGAEMPEGDRQCREKLLSQARAAIAKATKGA